MKQPPRVLLVLTSLAQTSGGGHAFATGLARVLACSEEVEAVLVLPRELELGVLPPQLASGALRVRPLHGLSRIARDIFLVHHWARRCRADVVIYPHEWAAFSGRTPLVNIVQNVLHLDPLGRRARPLKSLIMRTIVRVTAFLATQTIAVSPSAREAWTATTKREASVLPEGIAPEFANASRTERDDLVVIMTGDAPHKNPQLARTLAQELAQAIPAASIDVIGSDLSGSLPPNVRVRAYSDPPTLARTFGRARLVILTSTVESFGLPAFEARAAGAAVVVALGSPMAEWLTGDPYVFVARPNASSFLSVALKALDCAEWTDPSNPEFEWSSVGPQWVQATVELSRRQI